jgi:hypothetical protein
MQALGSSSKDLEALWKMPTSSGVLLGDALKVMETLWEMPEEK